MAWAIADVRRIAPEFAPVADADITALISDADLQISPTAWTNARDPASGRTVRDIAGTWLTAHLVALVRPELLRGTVVSKSVGGVSVSYASPLATTPAVLGSTRFGREYLRMVSEQAGAALDVL